MAFLSYANSVVVPELLFDLGLVVSNPGSERQVAFGSEPWSGSLAPLFAFDNDNQRSGSNADPGIVIAPASSNTIVTPERMSRLIFQLRT